MTLENNGRVIGYSDGASYLEFLVFQGCVHLVEIDNYTRIVMSPAIRRMVTSSFKVKNRGKG